MVSRSWGYHLLRAKQVKVAAVVRIRIPRRIVPVEVEASVPGVVPIATEPDRPGDVRIDEVGAALSIPFYSIHLSSFKSRGGPLHPHYWAKQRSPP